MAFATAGLIARNWQIFHPPTVKKADGALKWGILGAANIAPMALINPAKSHPDIVIQAVAARDTDKAAAYARKHGIPEVKASYQAILDDPGIDVVYIPLPNGLHFEWALKALKAGKHVLLEKPSVSNAIEAERLFHSSLATAPGAPVLLEAFHYRFQPQWIGFLSLLDRPNLEHLVVEGAIPSFSFPADDIRFRYGLAGGAMMDFGTYFMSVVRQVFGAEPEECIEATVQTMPPPEEKADYAFDLTWRMPNGATAHTKGSLRSAISEMVLPKITVTHRAVKEQEGSQSLKTGEELFRTRRIMYWNWMVSAYFHRITVEDEFIIRKTDSGAVVKKWKKYDVKRIYTFKDAGLQGPGVASWTTYRHQLEQFVNRVRGRETMAWIDLEDSIAQMKMIDMAYTKAGLPLRPTSEYE